MSRPLARKVGVGLVVTGVLLVLVWVGRTAYAAVDLIGQLKTMQAFATSDISVADPLAVPTVLRRTQRDVDVLQQEVGWFLPAATRLRWLPKVGPLLSEVPVLLALGDDLTDLGVLLWDDAAPALARYRQGESWQRLLPDLLAALGDGIELKQDLADRALVQFERLDVEAIPSSMRQYVDLLGKGLPFLVDGLNIVEVAPSLLGYDSPKTYLVLALNEDELRPGGGFITGVGEVRVVAGDVASMEFRDSYAVDDFSMPYPDPPEALRQFLGIDLWVFRDSNWSPDFPTAARQAIELYRPGSPVQVAGVFAIDQQGVRMLLDGLGPVQVQGVSTPVAGDTVLGYMHDAWAPEDGELDADWWRQRKSFMGDFAAAGMAKLRSMDVDVTELAMGLVTALDQRHVQVYVDDPVAQGILAARGWDGALARSATDFLALAEANVGYNKASALVDRAIVYEVDLRGATPQAKAVVRYRHLSDRDNACQPELRYDAIYGDMMHRCYWAYLRLYVPDGAVLIGGSPSPIPDNLVFSRAAWPGVPRESEDLDHVVISQALLLPTGGEKALEFRYALPSSVVRLETDGSSTYRLLLRKQAGTAQLRGKVTLLLPDSAVVLGVQPHASAVQKGTVVTEFDSVEDVEIVLRYHQQ